MIQTTIIDTSPKPGGAVDPVIKKILFHVIAFAKANNLLNNIGAINTAIAMLEAEKTRLIHKNLEVKLGRKVISLNDNFGVGGERSALSGKPPLELLIEASHEALSHFDKKYAWSHSATFLHTFVEPFSLTSEQRVGLKKFSWIISAAALIGKVDAQASQTTVGSVGGQLFSALAMQISDIIESSAGLDLERYHLSGQAVLRIEAARDQFSPSKELLVGDSVPKVANEAKERMSEFLVWTKTAHGWLSTTSDVAVSV